jgi:oligopeptide/dipeptide ABC transporter ATP-binding protein
MNVVEVEHLAIDYGRRHPVHAVRDVSLTIAADEFVGLVGESGCGKSTLGFGIAHLLRPPARRVGGSVRVLGTDWATLPPEAVRRRRWAEVAVVLQSGMNALNPIMTVGAQFDDVMRQHTDWPAAARRARMEQLLAMVQLAPEIARRYPHELSGGQKQRVAIALALVLHPQLVVMDEPTTALDVVVQRQIVENLKALRAQERFAVLFISHDLGLVLELADRVVVMYAGEVVEEQPAAALLRQPWHPYTEALMRALPDPEDPSRGLTAIPGAPPDLHHIPAACLFAPRCPLAEARCRAAAPPLEVREGAALRCWVRREEWARERVRA